MKNRDVYDRRIPVDLPLLEGPGGSLARAAPADGRLFSITTRRGAAWGTGLRGVEEIRAGRWNVTGISTDLGAASNVLVEPHSVRRELVDAGGVVLETMLLAQRVPAVIVQWRRPEGSDAPVELELCWTVSCNVPGRVDGDADVDRIAIQLRPERRDLDETSSVVFMRPTPTRWDVLPQDDRSTNPTGVGTLRFRARLHGSPGQAVSVIFIAGATEDEREAAFRAMSAARVEEVRAEQRLATSRAEGLALHTGVADLDEGLEWAKARVRSSVPDEPGELEPDRTTGRSGWTVARSVRLGGGPCVRPWEPPHPRPFIIPASPPSAPPPLTTSPFTPEAEACWVALGALASGEPEPADIVLGGDIASAYHLLLAARYVAWTGSEQRLLEHAGRLDATIANIAAHGAPDAAVRIALRELADAWEAVGDRKRAADIRAHLPSADARTSGRRLPLIGDASEDPREEELVEALLTNDARTSFRAPGWDPGGGLERGLRAWALLRSGDPELGYSLLREHLASGFRGGFGMWSEAADVEPDGVESAACADHTASAALVPCAVLFGLLGAVADAPLARMRLAPRLPAAWKSFEVRGIRAGDASLSLRYERENQRHIFRIRQDDGRIPVMLVFEPEVPAARIDDALVDGPAADLMRTSRPGRSGVRVQLPLASERVITLIGEGGP